MEKKKNSILIFGAFNPVTDAHIDMGVLAKRKYPDSNVYFIPCTDEYIINQKKEKALFLTQEERVGLLINAVRQYSDFYVSLVDIKNIVGHYCYGIVNFYRMFSEPIVVIGADKFNSLYLWHKWRELVSENKFLIMNRNNRKRELPVFLEGFEQNFEYLQETLKYQEISSTSVRKAYEEDKLEDVRDILPGCVYDYLNYLRGGCIHV